MDFLMKEIKDNQLSEYGIITKHNIMDNGEKRFRLIGGDGSSYIRTEASINSGWQNSHYHTTLKELYLIQKGSVIFAELINNKIHTKKYSEGEFFISQPMISHNVYMFPNTITHTIKFGDCSKPDWNEAKELDDIIKTIDINAITQ